MQDRHQDRESYFREQTTTCRNYYIPYIQNHKFIREGMRVLEIGCGEGGNLLPFSQMGCRTLGVDISQIRIKEAIRFFADNNVEGRFIATDIFCLNDMPYSFDIIICHDVIEHIDDKQELLSLIARFLAPDGLAFISFPAWQMPFGGHQQICSGNIVSHLPFIHLLPLFLYKQVLSNESDGCIEELLSIRKTRTTIEMFEKTVRSSSLLNIVDKTFYLVNPHYEVKFGMKPRRLHPAIGSIPRLRNFLTSSCFYLCSPQEQNAMH